MLIFINLFSRHLARATLYAVRSIKTILLPLSIALLPACAHLPDDANTFEDFRISEIESTQGDRASKLLQAAFPVVEDVQLNARVDPVLAQLVKTAKLSRQDFDVVVLKTDMVQAYALPNGDLFITTGLLTLLESDAELAAVLSHEVAHVVMHDAKEGQTFAESAIRRMSHFSAQHKGNEVVASDFAATAYFGVRREQELQADRLGFLLLKQAGYPCSAFPLVLEKLIFAENAYGVDVDTTQIYDDHPATRERLQKSRALMKEYRDAC